MRTTDYLIIDGTKMPPLTSLEISKEKIWSSNTGRNTSGKLIGDWISTKYTLKCEWNMLTAEEVARIDGAISKSSERTDPDTGEKITANTFKVKFYDPGTLASSVSGSPSTNGSVGNAQITKIMYAGTPTYPVRNYMNGRPVYGPIKVDLIEI